MFKQQDISMPKYCHPQRFTPNGYLVSSSSFCHFIITIKTYSTFPTPIWNFRTRCFKKSCGSHKKKETGIENWIGSIFEIAERNIKFLSPFVKQVGLGIKLPFQKRLCRQNTNNSLKNVIHLIATVDNISPLKLLFSFHYWVGCDGNIHFKGKIQFKHKAKYWQYFTRKQVWSKFY